MKIKKLWCSFDAPIKALLASYAGCMVFSLASIVQLLYIGLADIAIALSVFVIAASALVFWFVSLCIDEPEVGEPE